jgi:hypothetical protein
MKDKALEIAEEILIVFERRKKYLTYPAKRHIADLIRPYLAPKWTSVEDKLPDSDNWVLVYADGAINCAMFTPKHGFYDATHALGYNVNVPLITHWMPLPEAPK